MIRSNFYREPERYRHLDVLRALAALSVLFWHYQSFYYPAAGAAINDQIREGQPLYRLFWPLYHYGHYAVQLFWALSGFVFATTYIHQPLSKAYFVNRLARLYPLHALTLVLVAALQALSMHLTGHYQIYLYNDAYHFGLNALMIQAWGFQEGFSFNAPTWSVSVEVAIYGAFFLTIPFLSRFPIVGTTICLVSAVLTSLLWKSYFPDCALFFYCGVLGWSVLKARTMWAGVVGAGLILVVILRRLIEPGIIDKLDLALLFSGLIIAVAWLDFRFAIPPPSLDWIANTTYSTYLLHVPIQILTLTVVQHLLIDQMWLANRRWFLILYLASVFGLGVLCYQYIEKPAQRWVKSAFAKPRAYASLNLQATEQTNEPSQTKRLDPV